MFPGGFTTFGEPSPKFHVLVVIEPELIVELSVNLAVESIQTFDCTLIIGTGEADIFNACLTVALHPPAPVNV